MDQILTIPLLAAMLIMMLLSSLDHQQVMTLLMVAAGLTVFAFVKLIPGLVSLPICLMPRLKALLVERLSMNSAILIPS